MPFFCEANEGVKSTGFCKVPITNTSACEAAVERLALATSVTSVDRDYEPYGCVLEDDGVYFNSRFSGDPCSANEQCVCQVVADRQVVADINDRDISCPAGTGFGLPLRAAGTCVHVIESPQECLLQAQRMRLRDRYGDFIVSVREISSCSVPHGCGYMGHEYYGGSLFFNSRYSDWCSGGYYSRYDRCRQYEKCICKSDACNDCLAGTFSINNTCATCPHNRSMSDGTNCYRCPTGGDGHVGEFCDKCQRGWYSIDYGHTCLDCQRQYDRYSYSTMPDIPFIVMIVFIVPYLWFLYALENGTVNKATAAAFHIFISHMIALGSSLPVLTFGSIPESTLTVPTQYFMWNWANSFRYCYSWHCWPCPFARWH